MSQEHNDSNRRQRRTARSQRNRPVLVNSTSVEQSEQPLQEIVEEAALPVVPTPAPKKEPGARRLPNFFSTLGKNEQGASAKETDVAQARLARATRNKSTSQTSATTGTQTARTAKDDQQTAAKTVPATSKTASARPASPFKTRYIIGMAIYLLGANFIGAYEQLLLRSLHMETLLTQFNLFGGQVRIYTSTLLFLATLVVLLVLLARFDLIPRSLGAATGTSQRKPGQQHGSNRDTADGSRTPPPTMKQGVKGADDKLYQEYRANQRREKKK